MPFSDIGRAAEDRFHRDLIPVLKARGWRPRVIPYDGYGTSTEPSASHAGSQSSHGTNPPENTNSIGPHGATPAATPSQAGHAIGPRNTAQVSPTQASPPRQARDGVGHHPETGHPRGGSMARILARMVMRPAGAPAEGPLFRHIPEQPPATASQARDIARESLLDAQRGWRQFIDAPVPYLPVTIECGRARVRTRADRGGYIDVVVRDHGLTPGWHTATIHAAGSRVTTRVMIVPSGPRLGVICDIDDTVMVTNVPRAFIAGWNLLMKHAANREAVPGMAELLAQVRGTSEPSAARDATGNTSDTAGETASAHTTADAATPASTGPLGSTPNSPGGTEVPMIYLSTGAWNVVPTLRGFFQARGLPEAPMLMTDWGPTNTGWFRSGIEHKRTELRRLLIDFPEVTWLLIGDNGQHDPLIYSEIVREHSDRIAAIAIRQLSYKEQVLAGAQFANPMGIGPAARTLAEADVPVVVGRDGYELARLLPPGLLGA